MSEIARITQLLEEAFEGTPYYGRSVLGTLEPVTADIAIRKPMWSAHSIWELVAHLTAELNHVRIPAHRERPFRSNLNAESDGW